MTKQEEMKLCSLGEPLITIDESLGDDFVVTGEAGLATLYSIIRSSWKDSQPVTITAKRVIFKPDKEEK